MEEIVGIPIVGSVIYFQRDDLTGLIVPGTKVEDHNTINSDLTFYLAYKIGTNTINQSLNNRFTVGGALSSGDNGYDGIAYGGSSDILTYKLDTDINAGGTNAENYIEFVGSIAGPLVMSGVLVLGGNYLHSVPTLVDIYATYNISADIESGRTFYFYWRLTVT